MNKPKQLNGQSKDDLGLLDEAAWQAWCDKIDSATCETLSLVHTYLYQVSVPQWEALGNIDLSALTSIDLSDNQLHRCSLEQLNALKACLDHAPNLTELYLNHNYLNLFTLKQLRILGEIGRSHPNLSYLELKGNNLHCHTMDHWQIWQNFSLQHLDLSDNNLEQYTFMEWQTYVIGALSPCRKLTKIIIQSPENRDQQPLPPSHQQALEVIICDHKEDLLSLEDWPPEISALRETNTMGRTRVKNLVKLGLYLQNDPDVQELSLRSTDLETQDLADLYPPISHLSLQFLDLSHNPCDDRVLSEQGIETPMTLILQKQTNLEALDLSYTRFSSQTLLSLAKALMTNTSLKTADLLNIAPCNHESSLAFLASLFCNTQLKKVRINAASVHWLIAELIQHVLHIKHERLADIPSEPVARIEFFDQCMNDFIVGLNLVDPWKRETEVIPLSTLLDGTRRYSLKNCIEALQSTTVTTKTTSEPSRQWPVRAAIYSKTRRFRSLSNTKTYEDKLQFVLEVTENAFAPLSYGISCNLVHVYNALNLKDKGRILARSIQLSQVDLVDRYTKNWAILVEDFSLFQEVLSHFRYGGAYDYNLGLQFENGYTLLHCIIDKDLSKHADALRGCAIANIDFSLKNEVDESIYNLIDACSKPHDFSFLLVRQALKNCDTSLLQLCIDKGYPLNEDGLMTRLFSNFNAKSEDRQRCLDMLFAHGLDLTEQSLIDSCLKPYLRHRIPLYAGMIALFARYTYDATPDEAEQRYKWFLYYGEPTQNNTILHEIVLLSHWIPEEIITENLRTMFRTLFFYYYTLMDDSCWGDLSFLVNHDNQTAEQLAQSMGKNRIADAIRDQKECIFEVVCQLMLSFLVNHDNQTAEQLAQTIDDNNKLELAKRHQMKYGCKPIRYFDYISKYLIEGGNANHGDPLNGVLTVLENPSGNGYQQKEQRITEALQYLAILLQYNCKVPYNFLYILQSRLIMLEHSALFCVNTKPLLRALAIVDQKQMIPRNLMTFSESVNYYCLIAANEVISQRGHYMILLMLCLSQYKKPSVQCAQTLSLLFILFDRRHRYQLTDDEGLMFSERMKWVVAMLSGLSPAMGGVTLSAMLLFFKLIPKILGMTAPDTLILCAWSILGVFKLSKEFSLFHVAGCCVAIANLMLMYNNDYSIPHTVAPNIGGP